MNCPSMAMFTTPERSHMTPESEPKTSTMVAAELPTNSEVKLMKPRAKGLALGTTKQQRKQEENAHAAEARHDGTPWPTKIRFDSHRNYRETEHNVGPASKDREVS